MAIKSDLINIPLKGELNLSQNKLDVNNPAEGGYLKNNGVLYGNVLSPVYRENTNQPFDFMDKNKNRYTVGNGSLKKNGTWLFGYESNEFNKETLDLAHVDSLYDKTHYITVDATRAQVYGIFDSPIGINGVIFATKMINESSYIVLYKPTSSNTIQLRGRINNVNITPVTTDLLTDELTAPVLNVHKYEYNNDDYYVISLITDSGSGVGAHRTLSWCYNATITSGSLKPMDIVNNAGSVITAKKIEKYDFQLYYYNNDYLYYNARTQAFAFGAPRDPNGPRVVLHYQSFSSAKPSSEALQEPIDPTAPGYGTTSTTAEWSFKANGLTGSTSTICHHLTEYTIDRGWYVNGFYWVEISDPGATEWKDSYTDEEIEQAENEVIRFKLIPSQTGSSVTPTSKTHIEPAEYSKDYLISVMKNTIISSTGQNCDAILDDGTIIQTQQPETDENGVYAQGLYNFTGTLSSISYASDKYTLTYNSSSSEAVLLGQAETVSNNKYPYKPKEGYGQVSLGWNYYRNNIVAEGYPYTEEDEEKKYITTFLYDSGFANSNGGVLMQSGYNVSGGIGAGSVVQVGNWRVLYNNNLLAGISYSEDQLDTQIGTLVTDWLTVSKILNITENDVYYLNNAGIVEHISVSHNTDTKYTIARDRFVVINTTSYLNCWDLKYNQSIHWASDWNNRTFEGVIVPNKLQITGTNNSFLNGLAVNSTVSMASAQNANFEMTLGRSVSSAIFPPEVLSNVALENTFIIRGKTSEPIDFYRADSGLVVIYIKSFRNNIFYKDVNLEGALYPVSDSASSSIMYNPNIFTRFVRTYNNNDMMISNDVAYPLMKYNGDIIMLALLTKGLENMQNIFVLQTLYYGIGDGKIWEIYYDNSTITNYQAIIDVNGMTYLGQLPTEALFWSPMNRSIYSFTGDAILRQLWHCNDISDIYNTFYNPATQELFISTDIGLLCVSNNYTYLLDDIYNVENMYFYDDSFYVDGHLADDTEVYIKISYEYQSGMAGTVHIATKYFGSIENQKIHINAVYIKLYNDYTSDLPKVFKIRETTVTDKSTTTDWKDCNIDWDNDKWGYVRYQPKYQKGSSISFEVKSDAPIISMSVGYNPIDENAQFARNNI